MDPALGGPIKKDTLWFFGSVRTWKTDQTIAGMFHNLNPQGSHVYTPDPSRPAFEGDRDGNQSLRLTWKVSAKHKISAQQQVNQQIRDHFYGQGAGNRLLAPDAIINYNARPSYLSQVGWTAPVTNRLLFEGGLSLANKDFHYYPQPEVGPDPPSWIEGNTNIRWGNMVNGGGFNASHNWNAAGRVLRDGLARGEVRHNFLPAHSTMKSRRRPELLLNGLPRSVTVGDTDVALRHRQSDVRLCAQDQWTVNRLTLNVGLPSTTTTRRARTASPGPQVPTRNIVPALPQHPQLEGVSPRLALHLFGNGRTAVKASVALPAKKPQPDDHHGSSQPDGSHRHDGPRTWTDSNGDFIPRRGELRLLNQSRSARASSRAATRGSGEPGLRWKLGEHPASAGAQGLRDRGLFPPLVRQLHRDRQHPGDVDRLQPVLRHRTGGHAVAWRWRLSGLRPLRHLVREVRAVEQRRQARERLWRAARGLQRRGSQPQRRLPRTLVISAAGTGRV
jgi:hypothetical protein